MKLEWGKTPLIEKFILLDIVCYLPEMGFAVSWILVRSYLGADSIVV